ncbi:hypothetical protein BRD18_00780 [Halobacteriales archaeon SW_7_71_33]|nr:MAG: hypothetical protein BRD18_00780 [Halobacteriales archaeon SW_7_71_33]
MSQDERTRFGPGLVAHAVLSVALLYGPLLVAVRASTPGEPLFPGLAGSLVPVYYLGVLGVMLVPSVRSFREPTDRDAPGNARRPPAVEDLRRRYVEGDISESEFERELERQFEE